VAFEVDDSRAATRVLADAGAEVNSRWEAPGSLQLTLFTELGE
jgi:lactoylglutathione lyase